MTKETHKPDKRSEPACKSQLPSTVGHLVENISKADVESIQDRGMRCNRAPDEDHETKHSNTRVPQLGSLSKPRFKRRVESRWRFVSLSRLQEQLILEGERGECSTNRNQEHVNVSDENDSPLRGDRGSIAKTSYHAPLREIKRCGGVGDESLALAVACEDENEEAEHSVATVPALGFDGGAPAALGKGWVFLLVVGHGLGKDGKDLHTNGGRAAGGDREGGDADS